MNSRNDIFKIRGAAWAWGDLLLRNPYSTFLFYSVVVRHCVIHIPHFILLGSSTTQSIFPRIFQHLKIAATLYIPNDFLEYGVKAKGWARQPRVHTLAALHRWRCTRAILVSVKLPSSDRRTSVSGEGGIGSKIVDAYRGGPRAQPA